jgi:hypothetical protein
MCLISQAVGQLPEDGVITQEIVYEDMIQSGFSLDSNFFVSLNNLKGTPDNTLATYGSIPQKNAGRESAD